jgi:hypothetical protein
MGLSPVPAPDFARTMPQPASQSCRAPGSPAFGRDAGVKGRVGHATNGFAGRSDCRGAHHSTRALGRFCSPTSFSHPDSQKATFEASCFQKPWGPQANTVTHLLLPGLEQVRDTSIRALHMSLGLGQSCLKSVSASYDVCSSVHEQVCFCRGQN